MAKFQQKNSTLKGLNLDDEPRFLAEGEYRDAVNLHIGTSGNGFDGSAETIRGNTLIENSFLTSIDANYPSVYTTIGTHTSRTTGCIYYFICDVPKTYNGLISTNANHLICEYNYNTNTISKIASGRWLNFHPHNLITGTAYNNGILAWNDGAIIGYPYKANKQYNAGEKIELPNGNILIATCSTFTPNINTPTLNDLSIDWVLSKNPNPPRKINIQRMRESVDDIDLVVQQTYKDAIDMVKRPPILAPVFNLNLGENSNFTNDSYQFSARYNYIDGEQSVWQSASELCVVSYSSRKASSVAIAIDFFSNDLYNDYKKEIKSVSFAFRDSYLSQFRLIETISIPTAKPLAGIGDVMFGLPQLFFGQYAVMGSNFKNNISKVQVGSLAFSADGIYIGRVKQVVSDTQLLLDDMGRKYTEPYSNGVAQLAISFIAPVVTINYKSYYIGITFNNSRAYSAIPLLGSSGTAKDYDRVPIYATTMTLTDGRLLQGNYIDNRGSIATNQAILNIKGSLVFPSTVPSIDTKVLKMGSSYTVGIQVKDYAGRRTVAYALPNIALSTPSQIGNSYKKYIWENISINEDILPSWVDSYQFLLSENQSVDYFVQGRVDHIYYNCGYTIAQIPIFAGAASNKEDNYNKAISGEYDYIASPNTATLGTSSTFGSIGLAKEMYYDISNWGLYRNNQPYNFVEGDVLDVFTTGGNNINGAKGDETISSFINVKIKRQDGRFLITDIPKGSGYNHVNVGTVTTNLIQVVGNGGKIYGTDDGALFNEYDSKTTSNILSSATTGNTSKIIACGESGYIGIVGYIGVVGISYPTEVLPTNTSATLRSVSCLNSGLNCIVVGDAGKIFFVKTIGGSGSSSIIPLDGLPIKDYVNVIIKTDDGSVITFSVITKDGFYYHCSYTILTTTVTILVDFSFLTSIFKQQSVTYENGIEYTVICGQNTANGSGWLWGIKNSNNVSATTFSIDMTPMGTIGIINTVGMINEIGTGGYGIGGFTTTANSTTVTYSGNAYNDIVVGSGIDMYANTILPPNWNGDAPFPTPAAMHSFVVTAITNANTIEISTPHPSSYANIVAWVRYTSQMAIYCGTNDGKIYRRVRRNYQPYTSGIPNPFELFFTNTVFLVTPKYLDDFKTIDDNLEVASLIIRNDSTLNDVFIVGDFSNVAIQQGYVQGSTFRYLPLAGIYINYKAKIEIKRPKKRADTVLLYESILSSQGANSKNVKRTGGTKTYTIGDNEGDCFYIQKRSQGSRWAIAVDYIVSMTPVASDIQGLSLDTDGWVKGNNRPNIVVDDTLYQSYKPTGMRVSNNYIPNSNINGLCSYDEENEKIYPIEYVALRKTGTVTDQEVSGNVLICLFNNESLSVYINRTQLYDASGKSQLAIVESVLGSTNNLTGGFGTLNAESVVFENSKCYWWDASKGVICRYGRDGITPITEAYKVRNKYKKLADTIKKNKGFVLQKAIGTYDFLFDEYQVGVLNFQTNEYETICFSETRKAFTTFMKYSVVPDFQAKIGNKFVSFVDGNLWLHNTSTEYSTFFGIKEDSSLTVIHNIMPSDIKQARSLIVESTDKWSVPTFSSAHKSNDNPLDYTSMELSDFKMYDENENCFYADVQTRLGTPNQNTVNGDNMKGVYFTVKLKLDPSVNWLSNLYFVNLNFDISYPLNTK